MLDNKTNIWRCFFVSKFSLEEKLEAVQRVQDGMSQRMSAKIAGCSQNLVHQWCFLYEKQGIQGLSVKHGSYSGDFKCSVIEYMHENHLSYYETAAHFGIPSKTQVTKWERIYYEEGPQGLYRDKRGKPRKMDSEKVKKVKLVEETKEDLISEVQRLRMENEYLKKLNALVQERIARENGNEPPSSTN